ncbi:hypothetical protein RI367_004106 [Sorochytrium milnesiophthora]
MPSFPGSAEYAAPWDVYAVASAPTSAHIACSSFRESTDNKIAVLEYSSTAAPRGDTDNASAGSLSVVAEADTVYPVSKLLFSPTASASPISPTSPSSASSAGSAASLVTSPHAGQTDGEFVKTRLASTSHHLCLWDVDYASSANGAARTSTIGSPTHGTRPLSLTCLAVLSNSKSAVAAPLTSFDWCKLSPNLIVTSSIDTTCTVWDVETKQAKTQLIAHDKEVFDVSFVSGTKDIFSSVGADGSVRMFDLRSLEHSTIIYEMPNETPLLRLSWNVQDPNYLAVTALGAPTVTVLDIRVPSVPVAELSSSSSNPASASSASASGAGGGTASAGGAVTGHRAQVNAVAWAPHSAGTLLSCGEDGLVCVWDIAASTRGKSGYAPVLSATMEREMVMGSWAGGHINRRMARSSSSSSSSSGSSTATDSVVLSTANRVVLMAL